MPTMSNLLNFVIRTEADKARAAVVLQNLKITEGQAVEFVLKSYKKNRSQEQSKLMWLWNRIIGEALGMTPQEVHEILKRKCLKPILEAEDDEFRAILDNLRKAWMDGHKEVAESMELHVMTLASTSRLNVTQMTSYLNAVKDHADSLNIKLPMPEDRKRL